MKFTKHNNQNKRRKTHKPDYTERTIKAVNAMLADEKIGYNVPTETYKQIYNI